MRFLPVALAAAMLAACGDTGSDTTVDPPSIGEERALDDAREMIEQHAAPEAANEAAEEQEDAGE